MSIISSVRKSSLSNRSVTTSKSSRRSVRFQVVEDFKSVLTDIEKGEKEKQKYIDLCRTLREAGADIRDDEFLNYLTQTRSYVNIIGKDHTLFIQVLLNTRWAHRSADVVEAYHSFVLELCSAHNYFTGSVIDTLVYNFLPGHYQGDSKNSRFLDEEEEEMGYQRVHALLKALLHVVPMSVELLTSALAQGFPYYQRADSVEFSTYISNMLRLLDYRPELRQQLLSLIITKMLVLDVNTPRSELEEDSEGMFELEEECDETRMGHPLADNLDASLDVLFRYIHSHCHSNGSLCWHRTKALYADLGAVFDKVILPTHASHHVQFLIFYMLSFKSNLVQWFLQYLWRKVTDPNVFHVIRQAAIGYIASLLSRAKYVPMSALKETLTQLNTWIHSYIGNNCDSQSAPDPRLHAVFYSACQALFYLIAFRHKDIVLNSHKGLVYLQNLNLTKVVNCQLNPLRVCLPAVVSNFASVARHYQLAYCYSIIEHNQRNTIPVVYRDVVGAEQHPSQVYLDTFFPFDPYMLKRTKKYISEFYREYDSSLPDEVNPKTASKAEIREEEDDFLMEQSPANNGMFTYGTSPGFLQT